VYLRLASQIEAQLREAYARKHAAGEATQSSLAEKLGVNRSAVHRRLTGQTNMTVETIADMVWALGQEIDVRISEPASGNKNSSGVISGKGSSATTPFAVTTKLILEPTP
jgi:DNA-binding phage protein